MPKIAEHKNFPGIRRMEQSAQSRQRAFATARRQRDCLRSERRALSYMQIGDQQCELRGPVNRPLCQELQLFPVDYNLRASLHVISLSANPRRALGSASTV